MRQSCQKVKVMPEAPRQTPTFGRTVHQASTNAASPPNTPGLRKRKTPFEHLSMPASLDTWAIGEEKIMLNPPGHRKRQRKEVTGEETDRIPPGKRDDHGPTVTVKIPARGGGTKVSPWCH